jgi:phosphate transport system protein
MIQHTVKAFDAELETIRAIIAEMGEKAQQMLADAASALMNLDVDMAMRVVAADAHINALQRGVADKAIHTIARRQPVADDLREIMGVIRIATDLERIGDLAKSIARRATKIARTQNDQRCLVSLKAMHDRAAEQLKDALESYARRDVALARTIWERDQKLDALEDLAYRNLLTFMMEEAGNIPSCVELLFCAKNLERIGDRTKNIAETVVYIVTGEPEVYE